MFLFVVLAACTDPAAIATAIGSQNPVTREDGAKIAQNYDDPAVIDALTKALADPSEPTRLNAIESLAELEATGAGPALIDRLRNDPSPTVKRAAADALGRLKVKEAVPDLIAYLATFTPDDRDQLAGVWALGNIGTIGLDADAKKQTMDTLVALRDASQDTFVKYNTTFALRWLK